MLKFNINDDVIMAAAFAAIFVLALVLFWRKAARAKNQFDYSGLDKDELAFVTENLEDRLEDDVPRRAELIKKYRNENYELYIASRVLLFISSVLTAVYWFYIGNDILSSLVFAGIFGAGNYFILPMAYSKLAKGFFVERLTALPIALVIMSASLLAASGLASMTTSATRDLSKTAKSDLARIETQISDKNDALLGIDKSKTAMVLKADKKALQQQKTDIFKTQVRYTRNAGRRNKNHRGFGTLGRLSNHCASPGAVRDAGRLCKKIREINGQIGTIETKIVALGTAAHLRVQIKELIERRDKEASKVTSDPLAPIRALLPPFLAAGMVSMWALIIAAASELLIDGLSLMVELDAARKAGKELKRLRRKAFRKLKQDAYARYNPDKRNDAVPDVRLNQQMEEKLDEKLSELDLSTKKENERRELEFERRLSELDEQDKLRALEHGRSLVASEEKVKHFSRVAKQMKRAEANMSREAVGRRQPFVEYINARLVDVDGGAISLVSVVEDYVRWARLHDKPSFERGEIARMLEFSGLVFYNHDDATYIADMEMAAEQNLQAV